MTGAGDSYGGDQSNALIMQVQGQLGEIKGILQTIVAEHARRITDQEEVGRRLRTDLTSVKDETNRSVSDLGERMQKKFDDFSTNGSKAFADITGTLSTHAEIIKNSKEDIATIQERLNNGMSRAAIIISPVVSVLSILVGVILSLHH